MGQYVSGVIMYKETLFQAASSGKPFVECLGEQGVMPGIKVDEVGGGASSGSAGAGPGCSTRSPYMRGP